MCGLSRAAEDVNAQMLSWGAISLTPSSRGDPALQKQVKTSLNWPHCLDCPHGVWISHDMPLPGRATLAQTPRCPRNEGGGARTGSPGGGCGSKAQLPPSSSHSRIRGGSLWGSGLWQLIFNICPSGQCLLSPQNMPVNLGWLWVTWLPRLWGPSLPPPLS